MDVAKRVDELVAEYRRIDEQINRLREKQGDLKRLAMEATGGDEMGWDAHGKPGIFKGGKRVY